MILPISCSRYVGRLTVPYGVQKIGIMSPVIDLKITEQVKSSGRMAKSKRKVVRSIPKELLTQTEKSFLDSLILKTISICESKLSSKFIEIQSPKIESDFVNLIGENSFDNIHSNGFVTKKQVLKNLSSNTDKSLIYLKISDVKSENLKPKIDLRTGNNILIIEKADYRNFQINEDTKSETLVEINNYNFSYSENNQSGLENPKKDVIIEICSQNNLDALITINMSYQYENTVRILSFYDEWKIELKAKIQIYDSSGILVNENIIVGKSDFLKIARYDLSKIPHPQFIYNLSEGKIEIFEIFPRTRNSFSLQNIFGSLYTQATEDMLEKLSKIDKGNLINGEKMK